VHDGHAGVVGVGRPGGAAVALRRRHGADLIVKMDDGSSVIYRGAASRNAGIFSDA
jgi:hypothetical protein